MKRVYAYYSVKEGVKETLGEHISKALEAVNNLKKVLKYGLKLSKNFSLMLSLSVVLHDMGKVIYNQYFFNPSKDLSFIGHEVISTWFVRKLYEKTTDVNKDVFKISPEEWDIIAFSIINHHHPMNILGRCEKLKKQFSSKKIKINEDTIELFIQELKIAGVLNDEELYKIIINFKNEKFLSEVINVELGKIAEDVCGDKRNIKRGIYTSLWNRVWFDSRPEFRQLFLLNEQGLVVADYYAASANRGEATSDFGKAVMNFVRLYSLDYHLALNGV